IPPAVDLGGVEFRFGPVYTLFLTARLRRTPDWRDKLELEHALHTIEAHFLFSPAGIFTMVSYGIPYFNRLNRQPGATKRPLVAQYMPRLLSDHSRFVLEEAVPAPSDVVPGVAPVISRPRYNVPVTIERNDVLITLRSDSLLHVNNVAEWLRGSGNLRGHQVASPAFKSLFQFTSSRVMFVQLGLPRKLADTYRLLYADRIHPQSPMWMGFADQ